VLNDTKKYDLKKLYTFLWVQEVFFLYLIYMLIEAPH